MADEQIQQRKSDHLRIVTEEDIESSRTTLLECVHLMHQALPELCFDDVYSGMEFFGKQLHLPLMITSMTGGTESAGELNRSLAICAARHHVAFATGSMRVLFRHPERLPDFAVREQIPDGVLLGNIGGQQLREYSVDSVLGLVDTIDADGICVHLNPAHEMTQEEGDSSFEHILKAIGKLVEAAPGKVLVKEVGCGLSQDVVKWLIEAGVKYLDVAGVGGTSWSKVESFRNTDEISRRAAATLGEWGIPTAVCVAGANDVRGEDTVIVASGGIRNGLDVARSLVLGADLAGFAKPVLDAYIARGTDGVTAFIEQVNRELETAMLLTGSMNIDELRSSQKIVTGELKVWLRQLGILKPGK